MIVRLFLFFLTVRIPLLLDPLHQQPDRLLGHLLKGLDNQNQLRIRQVRNDQVVKSQQGQILRALVLGFIDCQNSSQDNLKVSHEYRRRPVVKLQKLLHAPVSVLDAV